MKEGPAVSQRPIKQGTRRVFKNKTLERLTRTHISIPVVLFNLIAIGLLYYGITKTAISVFLFVALFFLGLLFFTLLEYLMHKHVFHMLTDTKVKEKIQYNFHGIHHEYPKDKDRLAMPPVVSLLITVALYYVFNFLIGDYVYGFLPGLLFGYSAYLFVHFAVHAYPPPKNFLRILWINHSIHHYKNPEVAFGVSSPLWDYIFRTIPK